MYAKEDWTVGDRIRKVEETWCSMVRIKAEGVVSEVRTVTGEIAVIWEQGGDILCSQECMSDCQLILPQTDESDDWADQYEISL